MAVVLPSLTKDVAINTSFIQIDTCHFRLVRINLLDVKIFSCFVYYVRDQTIDWFVGAIKESFCRHWSCNCLPNPLCFIMMIISWNMSICWPSIDETNWKIYIWWHPTINILIFSKIALFLWTFIHFGTCLLRMKGNDYIFCNNIVDIMMRSVFWWKI